MFLIIAFVYLKLLHANKKKAGLDKQPISVCQTQIKLLLDEIGT